MTDVCGVAVPAVAAGGTSAPLAAAAAAAW